MRHGTGTFIKDVGEARKDLERRLRASDLVRRMLEDGARLGITGNELADAFQEEVGSKVHE
jgi:DNA-binding transcriptional regulator YhcF (GntR family)